MQVNRRLFIKVLPTKLVSLFLILVLCGGYALPAEASILSFLGLDKTADDTSATNHNAQTIPLPEPSATLDDIKGGQGGGDILIDDGALISDIGPLGTGADVGDDSIPGPDEISIYVVHSGDTLPTIAKMFNVSVNTIIWANDLSKGVKLKDGQVLVILPINGVSYKIKKGDTLKSIAKNFKSDAEDIGKFNGYELDSKLAVGDTIIIPDGEMAIPDTIVSKRTLPGGVVGKVNPKTGRYRWGSRRLLPGSSNGPEIDNYYIRPIAGGVRTQGLHGNNGIDIARMPIGTPVLAAADGIVIIARSTGWNGGFAKYIIIQHPNGTATLYGHLNKVMVTAGQHVSQGEQIGELGNTGNSTGPHLHFEIHGAKNPLGDNPSYGL